MKKDINYDRVVFMKENTLLYRLLITISLSLTLSIFLFLVVGDYVKNKKNETPKVDTKVSTVNDFDSLNVTTIREGSGDTTISGDTLVVKYKGYLSDGTVFDQTEEGGEPFTFKLGAGQVISGWDKGLEGMAVGEIRKIEIPSSLGYGSTGRPPAIPANAGLVFEVELVSFSR